MEHLMGIDRIGKGPGVPDVPAAANTTGAQSFELAPSEAASGAAALDPGARLARGEITLDQYLDLRVQQATAHLEGKLDSKRLSFIRTTLRSQLETDPTLVELVRAAASASTALQRGG